MLDKKQKYIKWVIIIIMVIVFINTCMMTIVPDDFILDSDEVITAYLNEPHHYYEQQIIPEKALQVDFEWHHYGDYLNYKYLNMFTGLFITKQYKTLYIKEISYNNNG